MTTSATTAISASSDQAKSNIDYFTIVSDESGADHGRRSLLRQTPGLGRVVAIALILRRQCLFIRLAILVLILILAGHIGQPLLGGNTDGLGEGHIRPWPDQASGAQLIDARQIGQAGETEMQEEGFGRN